MNLNSFGRWFRLPIFYLRRKVPDEKNIWIFLLSSPLILPLPVLTSERSNHETSEHFDNGIHIHQVHSCAGQKSSRMKVRHDPLLQLIAESKAASDSKPFWNIRLLRIRQWNAQGQWYFRNSRSGHNEGARVRLPWIRSAAERLMTSFLALGVRGKIKCSDQSPKTKLYFGFWWIVTIQIYKEGGKTTWMILL